MTIFVTESPADNDTPSSMLQVVAYNLRRARIERHLTQADLAARLEHLTGSRWSAVTVGQAESGWGEAPKRVRHFDVNEILAFSLALRLPVPWFFLPPPVLRHGYPPTSGDDRWITPSGSITRTAISANQLAALVFADAEFPDADNDIYVARLRDQFPRYLPAPRAQNEDVKYQRLVQRLREAIDEYNQEE